MIATSLLTAIALATSPPTYTAVVDARFTGADGAVVGGTPTYHTIGAALRALPADGSERATIFVRDGRYREKLSVDRANVTLIGESRDRTILTYDAIADDRAPDGGTYGTRGSFTLRVTAPDFHAEHLTVENAFDYAGNLRKAAEDSTRRRNVQGVALAIDGQADRASFEDVRVTGHQDTLFPNTGRSYFHRCEITGSVDFVFGAGTAVFEDCDIVSRDRGSPTNNGYVTAPSTPASRPIGFLFVRSRLRKESPAMAAASVVLGRPWHPSGSTDVVPSAVFYECWMDDHIGAKGWDRMGMTDATGARVWADPADARFFEHHSAGPGAVASPSRRQLSADDVTRYTVARALGDWTPDGAGTSTGSPDRLRADAQAMRSAGASAPRSRVASDSDWAGMSVLRVEELFIGRFPGVQVVQTPQGLSIRIRGTNSVRGNNEPLFVID
ncbi:MAG: pectinesterase family protein, partial [Gemmatimonadaceae bacterium]